MILKKLVLIPLVVGVLSLNSYAKKIEIEDGNLKAQAYSEAKIIKSDKLYKALGIGGRLGLIKNKFIKPEYSIGIELIVAQPLSVSNNIAQIVKYSKTNNKNKAVGTFYFNNLYLQYQKEDWSIKLLTQSVDTPLVGSGTSLFMPNSYDGITYKKTNYQELSQIQVGILNTITGSSAVSANQGMAKADTKNRIGGNGLFFAGAKLATFDITGYAYSAPTFGTTAESYTALYLEKINIDIAKGLDINLLNASYKTKSNFTLIGARAKINNIKVAMSMVSGDKKGVAYHFGNVPEYTKMEEFNLGSISVGTTALKAETNFIIRNKIPININTAFGVFMGKDKAGTYTDNTIKEGTILDLRATYIHSKRTNIVGLFEYQSLKATSNNSVDNNIIVGIRANYQF